MHRCRFVDWRPAGATCLAFTRDGARLAVGRANGGLEVWNVTQNYAREAVSAAIAPARARAPPPLSPCP